MNASLVQSKIKPGLRKKEIKPSQEIQPKINNQFTNQQANQQREIQEREIQQQLQKYHLPLTLPPHHRSQFSTETIICMLINYLLNLRRCRSSKNHLINIFLNHIIWPNTNTITSLS